MRPRKRILLIDSNELRQSTRRYMLTIRGFAVHAAASAEEARELASDHNPDLVIACWPMAGTDLGRLLDQLHDQHPCLRSMLLAEHLTAAPKGIHADACMYKGSCSPAEIVDRAKVLCARKHGPKKAVEIDRMMVPAERRIA